MLELKSLRFGAQDMKLRVDKVHNSAGMHQHIFKWTGPSALCVGFTVSGACCARVVGQGRVMP